METRGNSKGGFNASQKVYHCPECGAIGRGNRMISHHLQGCNGMGRKTKKSTEELKHRLEEAKINTELWFKEEAEKALYKDYMAAKERILESIEEMRQTFGTSYQASLEAYYKQIF